MELQRRYRLREPDALVISILSQIRSTLTTKQGLTVPLYPVLGPILTCKRETSNCAATAKLPPMQALLTAAISTSTATFFSPSRKKTSTSQPTPAQQVASASISMSPMSTALQQPVANKSETG